MYFLRLMFVVFSFIIIIYIIRHTRLKVTIKRRSAEDVEFFPTYMRLSYSRSLDFQTLPHCGDNTSNYSLVRSQYLAISYAWIGQRYNEIYLRCHLDFLTVSVGDKLLRKHPYTSNRWIDIDDAVLLYTLNVTLTMHKIYIALVTTHITTWKKKKKRKRLILEQLRVIQISVLFWRTWHLFTLSKSHFASLLH